MTETDLATYAGTWTLDAAATSIEFTTKAMWVLPVNGSFKAVSGTGVATPDGTVTGTLVIDPATVSTGMAKRDVHLLTDDFLDVATHPTLTYTGVQPAADGRHTLIGTFTALGQTHPLQLDRTAWGVSWTKMGAGVHNHLLVTAVFTRA